ncbi:hypothetical protein [Nocardia sp. NPDC003963]
MTDNTRPAGFGELIERVTVLHNSSNWSARYRDMAAVCGSPSFTDDRSWAAFASVSLGDESDLPAWCLLARTPDLDRLIARAIEFGWSAAPPVAGGHEIRAVLGAPSGLTVIAYTPLPR